MGAGVKIPGDDEPVHDGYRSMSLRLPRRMHEAMKALAARGGVRAAEFYVTTVEDFIRDHMAGYRHLFAIENDAVHVSINVPGAFAQAVRDAALARRVTPNELVFTAVSHELELSRENAA